MSSLPAAVTATVPLASLDHTLVIFDVDQPQNAKQSITIKKLSGHKCVGWRMLANAPTRYIVKPNAGLLREEESEMATTIELVNNRFNPQHQMVVEVIAFDDEKRWPEIWKKQLPTDEMQVIELELSTTVVNIESASRMTEGNKPSQTLSQMMEMSQTRGAERVKEMQEVLVMLKADNATLAKNMEQTERLKKVLGEQIRTKKTQFEENVKKTAELEKELKVLKEDSQRRALQKANEAAHPAPPQVLQSPCSLM